MKNLPKVLLLERPLEIASATSDVPLIPVGNFGMTDGVTISRHAYTDEELIGISARINVIISGTGLSFDMDHLSLSAWNADKPPKIVGSSKQVAFVAGVGIVAKGVTWNLFAKTAIDQHEFRYASPLIFYDSDANTIAAVVSAALTNTTRLGIEALRSLGTDPYSRLSSRNLAPLQALSTSLSAGLPDAAVGAAQLRQERDVCARMGIDHGQLRSLQVAELSAKVDSLATAMTNRVSVRDSVIERMGITLADFDAAGKAK